MVYRLIPKDDAIIALNSDDFLSCSQDGVIRKKE